MSEENVEPIMDNTFVKKIGQQLSALHEEAFAVYKPLVDEIVDNNSNHVQHIESTLDGLLGFAGHPNALVLYKRLCRHYWGIDQSATAFYINAYREMYAADSLPDSHIEKPSMRGP